MRNQLFSYMMVNFGFSRREAKGFILLCLFTIALMLTPFLLKQYYISSLPEAVNETALLDELTNDLGKREDDQQAVLAGKADTTVTKRLFVFDPNSISAEQFRELGLNEKLSKRIINYRNHGGVFKTKEDLKKIYGLSSKQYTELEPFVDIRPNARRKVVSGRELQEVRTKLMFDINLADSVTLLKMNGIGPRLAGRIVKFRKQLGGFYTVDQLAEVYGLDEETLDRISGQFWVAKDFEPNKIYLSSCSYETLHSHPYFRKHAGLIMKLKRSSKEKAITKEDLIAKELISEKEYQRLLPYLSD